MVCELAQRVEARRRNRQRIIDRILNQNRGLDVRINGYMCYWWAGEKHEEMLASDLIAKVGVRETAARYRNILDVAVNL